MRSATAMDGRRMHRGFWSAILVSSSSGARIRAQTRRLLRMTNFPRHLLLVALTVEATSACRAESGGTALSTVDSAGVSIWHLESLHDGDTTGIDLIAEIPVPDSGWIVEVDGVGVDRTAGRIYLLDELAQRILVLSESGEVLRTQGSRGEGPSQFISPSAIDVASDGIVTVVDPGRGLLLKWNRAGEFIGQERLPKSYWGPGLAVDGDRVFYVTGSHEGDAGSVRETLGGTSASESFDALATFVQPWVIVDLPCGTLPAPKIFAPSLTWAAGAGLVATSSWPDATIDVYEDSVLVHSFRLTATGERVARQDAVAAVETGQLNFLVENCGVTAAQVVDIVGAVETRAPVRRLAVDPNGRIWADVFASDGTDRLLIFDVTRGVIASLPSTAFPAAFLGPNRFVSVGERPWGSALEVWELRSERPRDNR